MKVAIITDSNSGITQKEAKDLGIAVASTPVLIDDETFHEDITITQEQFYEKLKSDANVSTSQPNPQMVGELWREALKTHDQIVYIPLSSGLSETCHTMAHVAQSEPEFKGRVFVTDNQRVSITQRQSVMDALKMAGEGKDAQQIYDWLIKTKMQSSIYIMVDTLKYLKKGGRLTPAAAMIGTLLKIKPVLQIQGEKLDQYKKVRKLADAKTEIINALKHDFETRFKDIVKAGKMTMAIAHTENFVEAEKFKQELIQTFPDVEFTVVNPLSLSVSVHIGPGSLAAACAIKY